MDTVVNPATEETIVRVVRGDRSAAGGAVAGGAVAGGAVAGGATPVQRGRGLPHQSAALCALENRIVTCGSSG
jgi:hypothetical protein